MAVKLGASGSYTNANIGSHNSFTWCGFVKPTGTGSFRTVVALANVADATHVAVWVMDPGGGLVKFMATFNDEAPDATQIPAGGLPNDAWYFLAITYNYSGAGTPKLTFYVRPVGSRGGFYSTSISANAGIGGIKDITIGKDTFVDLGPGTYAGHRCWSRVLSPAQLDIESQSLRAVSRVGLVVEYPLNSTADASQDASGNHRVLTPAGTITNAGGPPIGQYSPSQDLLLFQQPAAPVIPGIDCQDLNRPKVFPARVDAWSPLPTFVMPPVGSTATFTDTPGRPVPPARVDAWGPLSAVIATAVVGSAFSVPPDPPARPRRTDTNQAPTRGPKRDFGFTPGPEPKRRISQFDRNTNPLPAFTAPAVLGWGTSAAPLTKFVPRLDLNTNPIPAFIAPVVLGWGTSDAPLPRRQGPARDYNTAPIVAKNLNAVYSDYPRAPKVTRSDVAVWAPVPALAALAPSNWGFDALALGLRRAGSPPDAWQPLPALLAATVSGSGPECQAAAPTRQSRAAVDPWSPVAAVPAPPAAECLPTGSQLRRAPAVDAWLPLPTFVLAQAQEAVFPAPPARRSPWIDPWSPLPAFALVSDQSSASPVPPIRRSPWVDPWAPLPAFALTSAQQEPTTLPAVRRSPWVDPWLPLPAPPVALTTGQPSPSPLAPVMRRQTVDAWQPLPAFQIIVDQSSSFYVAPARRAPIVDPWQPLPGVTAPVASSFGWECASPLPSKVRPAPVVPWAPLPALIAVAIAGSGPECTAPAPRRPVMARVDAWSPLPAFAIVLDQSSVYPVPQLRRPPWVDPWGPLPAFTLAADQPSPSPVPPLRRAPWIDPWAPLPGFAIPAFGGFASTDPRRMRAALAEAWSPLPAPPLVPAWVFGATDTPPQQRRAPGDGWSPLPSVAISPTWAFSIPERQALLRRAPSDAWAPVGATLFPYAPQQAPEPQRPQRRIAQDWAPLAPPSAVALGFQPAPTKSSSVRRYESVWTPVGVKVPVIPWSDFNAPKVPLRRSPWVDPWMPIGSIPVNGGVFARFRVTQTPSGFFAVEQTPSGDFNITQTPAGKFRGT